jgi:hypothetical protein
MPIKIAVLAAIVVAVAVIAAVASEPPPRPEPRVLIPTADQRAVTWRYTFAEPAADWFKPDFNDSAWKEDDDGKVYFVYQNGKIARMKDDMTGLAETPRLLKPANAAQVGFEGAFRTKIDDRYHLACADFIGGNYHCMVASAEKIDGPYGDRYVAVPHGGHNLFFKDRSGQWWATFFGNDPRAPFRERPAILQIEVGPDGRTRPQTP